MMKLTIGRQDGTDAPRLAVTVEGKTSYYGDPGSVPKGVSRKHCEVTLEDDGTITIQDITSNNFMYVNGADCKRRKNLSLSDSVELGPSRYKLDLDTIVKAVSAKKDYSIAHLGKVYDDFQTAKMQMQIRERRFNAISRLSMIITPISLALALFWEKARIIGLVFTVVFGAAIVVFSYKSAENGPKKHKELEDAFRDKYVCPNPACDRFLGSIPYKELMKTKACPFCHAKFKA